MALQPFFLLLGPSPFFSFIICFTQTVGLLGRVISPSQGLYLHTGQHKHRINAHTNIHASSRIRTYDPSVRASEDSSCLRPLGYRGRHFFFIFYVILFFLTLCILKWPLLWSSGQSFWLQIQRSGVLFPALPDFLTSRESGTGSTQPRDYNWGATWMKK
jgi:hypothetical protein